MAPLIENSRTRVSEVVYAPGVRRESYVRPTDQVVVFLDEECRFERIDPVTGESTLRCRLRGEVLWHPRGELAPVLVNTGSTAFRTLLIEFL